MSSKKEMIQEMLEMQKKFMAYEQQNGVDSKDYFSPEEGHVLEGYRQKYSDLAMKVVATAHEEVGSHE